MTSRSSRSMSPSWTGPLWKGLLVLVILLAPPSSLGESGCRESEVRCLCGTPRCVDVKLVNNGVQDCADGSDEEGQWDLAKCGGSAAAVRVKRAGISELLRVTNGGATTTFFEGERGRTRPVGLLTTTMGSFQVSGTTTEYITKLIATYIKGTYARILTTTSRIYHALPTSGHGGATHDIRPTGFITSAMSTEVNGYATTVHTTDFYRTYIDNTYAQQMSATSNVYYPQWYTDMIQPSATPTDSSEDAEIAGKIYPTPVYVPIDDLMTLDSTPPVITHQSNGRFGRVLVNPHLDYPEGVNPPLDYPQRVNPPIDFPRRVNGQFTENPSGEVAPLAIFVGPPNAPPSFGLRDNEVRVTGTHGNFVAGSRTYNVFTGTYVQNSQTFLFFFGNTALSPSTVGGHSEAEQQTILVENGAQRDHLLVDMREKLKLIVPGTKERTTIDTTLDGEALQGVMVEIEGSENSGDDLIMVEGARPTAAPTPHDPRIAAVVVTLDKNIRKEVSKQKAPPRVNYRPIAYDDNEIPTGRSVGPPAPPPEPPTKLPGNPKAEPQVQQPIKPSKPSAPIRGLPTYTVGSFESESPKNYYEATTNSDEDLTSDLAESSTSASRGQEVKGRQPVFQKTFSPGRMTAPSGFSRKPKSFSDLRNLGGSAGWESNDLMSAASNRHATVTYVGFADFTTTVGNTVIVFMPRTRMLEDLSLHASATQTVRVDPTRYTYLTTTEEEPPSTTPKRPEPPSTTPKRPEPSSTTPKRPEPPTTTPRRPEPVTVPEIIEITTPKPPSPPPRPKPKFTRKTFEASTTTTSSAPPPPQETTVLLSGRQTLFSTLKYTTPAIPTRTVPGFLRPSPTLTTSDLVLTSRQPTVEAPRLETVVFQKDKHNPTGLVSSIGGSFVHDSTTTLVTSLVIGTYIEGSYAQVIKSTSTVFFQPSSPTVEPTPLFIRPTPVPKLISTFPSATSKSPVFSYTFEVTTSNPEDEETTTADFERAEVRVTSSTTEVTTTAKEAETEEPATTAAVLEEEKTTTSLPINIQKEDLDEALNEIERARKVAGRPQDQIIVQDKKVDSTLEKPTDIPVEEKVTSPQPIRGEKAEQEPIRSEEEDQTVYVTKTVPTTVFRTYTYFTTYFIPKQDSTLSSVISREVTSTAVGFVKKTFSSILPTATVPTTPEPTAQPPIFSYEDEDEDEDVAPTFYKTYFTTFTYLTTFFTGETSSISSREEVISSVSTITQLPGSSPASESEVTPTIASAPESAISESPSASVSTVSSTQLPSVVEQTILKTFFTTYTYFSTLFNGAEASTRSRIEVITNVVPTVMRSTVSALPPSSIQPSSVHEPVQAKPSAALNTLEDLSEGGSDVSETSQATNHEPSSDYYELESSEMTTDRSVYNEQELQELNGDVEATPALKTLFTTFSFFTTYYKGGSSSVATRLQTLTNVVSDGVESEEATDADQFPVFPITYLTTFTYWTTHFKGESTVVSSREETISNVVTPGVDDVNPSISATEESITVKPTVEPLHREPKNVAQESDPESDDPELELTTYFTTFTYFTSSYIGDETIVNSRLETVTNVVSGTPSATLPVPSSTAAVQARVLGPSSPSEQELIENEHLPVGLLSTVTNREVIDQTTTEYLTDVYGTYIDGIYAQVLESTSRVIVPTAAVAQTKFILEATEMPTGLLALNQGKTVEGDGKATTFYQTATVGSFVDGTYAQVISSSSSVSREVDSPVTHGDDLQKTGLVRVIDGSLVQGDKTTFYTSSIYGTVIDDQYGQIIESTTRYVISPTAPLSLPVVEATLTTSEVPLISAEVETPTTTTEAAVEVDTNPLKRFPGRGRDRGRINYTQPTSKSSTPFITPFASRSRPTFTPKKATAAVIVSRDDVTPTVTATLAPTSTRGVQNRPRFRRPGSQEDPAPQQPTVSPTPRLPVTTGRSRFQRPGGLTSTTPTLPANSVLSSNSVPPRLAAPRPSITPARVNSVSRPSSSRFSLRPRGSLAPSRLTLSTAPTAVAQPTTPPPSTEPEEKEEEEESTVVTTEPSKSTTTATRFGNNRFRLNPKLNVLHLLSSTTTERTTTAPRVRKTFTRPTLPSRAAPSSTTEEAEEEQEEEPESGSQSETPIPTTTPLSTGKPSLKNLLASRKLTTGNRAPPPPPPPSNPRPANRQITTTPSPTPRTTTRRSFAPRARPQGFPSRGLVRGSTTEKSEEELDFDESKNVPGSLEKLEVPKDASLLADSFGVEEGGDLVDSGSEFFETVRSPYESYEVYDDGPGHRGGFRRRLTRQVDYGQRSRAEILRSSFRRGGREAQAPPPKSNFPLLSPPDFDASSGQNDADMYEYYYDDETPPPTTTTPKPKTTASARSSSRFRGRLSSISPSPAFSSSRQTPFTLLPPSTTRSSSRTSPSNAAALLNNRRTQSRYREHSYSTTPQSRTTSRFKSRNQFTTVSTTPKPKSRFISPIRNRGSHAPLQHSYEEPRTYEKPTERPRTILTVTHFLPSETTVPVVNGKVTEFKTLLIPSPSVEVISPYQYTYTVDNGVEVRVLNSQVTSTPSVGFGGEVTRFLIREVPTTVVTFTPTTIRGRKTSFSHVLSTHYYTVDPTVSTIGLNTFTNAPGDSNQLTNLLLSQLLGSLNLAGLQHQQMNQMLPHGEPATPQTHYSTKTSTYVTTITDFTSTVVPITLHGKAIKTTIVESHISVLTATELITESTVYTPTVQTQAPPPASAGGINPALLQSLLQQQLQIQPTAVEQLPTPSSPSVVTLFVSGKSPGEFSTVVTTVTSSSSEGRKRRDIAASHVTWPEVQPTVEAGPMGREVELDGSVAFSEGTWNGQSQINQDSFLPKRTQSLGLVEF